MTDHLIVNPYFINRFLPLELLRRKKPNKGSFFGLGSLNSIVKEINTGLLPDFETDYDFTKEYQDVNLDQGTVEFLEKKHGIKIGKVRIIDKSHLKDKIIDYFKNYVKLDDMWKDILGKNIWIVLTSFYTEAAEKVQEEKSFFSTSTSHTRVSTEGDDWICFGFTCLKMKVKRDGTIGKIEMVKQ